MICVIDMHISLTVSATVH